MAQGATAAAQAHTLATAPNLSDVPSSHPPQAGPVAQAANGLQHPPPPPAQQQQAPPQAQAPPPQQPQQHVPQHDSIAPGPQRPQGLGGVPVQPAPWQAPSFADSTPTASAPGNAWSAAPQKSAQVCFEQGLKHAWVFRLLCLTLTLQQCRRASGLHSTAQSIQPTNQSIKAYLNPVMQAAPGPNLGASLMASLGGGSGSGGLPQPSPPLSDPAIVSHSLGGSGSLGALGGGQQDAAQPSPVIMPPSAQQVCSRSTCRLDKMQQFRCFTYYTATTWSFTIGNGMHMLALLAAF